MVNRIDASGQEHSQQRDVLLPISLANEANVGYQIMSGIISDWLAQDESKRDMQLLGGDAIAVVIAGR